MLSVSITWIICSHSTYIPLKLDWECIYRFFSLVCAKRQCDKRNNLQLIETNPFQTSPDWLLALLHFENHCWFCSMLMSMPKIVLGMFTTLYAYSCSMNFLARPIVNQLTLLVSSWFYHFPVNVLPFIWKNSKKQNVTLNLTIKKCWYILGKPGL